MSDGTIDGLIVFTFGAAVGIGELVSRYRDDPASALKTLPAFLYVSLNALGALLALMLIHVFGWTFGVDATNKAAISWTQMLIAGFGSLAFFRSSLFTVRVGDGDIPMGPNAFLLVVLGAADRAVDRKRAQARANAVADAMVGVPFQKAQQALPTLCLALMQNVPAGEQSALAHQLDILARSSIDDRTKALVLALHLMNVVGEGVIVDAVSALGSQIATIIRVEVSSVGKSLSVGGNVQLQAQAYSGRTRAVQRAAFQWRSLDPTIASVSPGGLVMGVAPGSVDIEATCEGVSGRSSVTVA